MVCGINLEKNYGLREQGAHSSIPKRLFENWPNAKFIHNYRDCREVAISMMTGSFFRLYLELTQNPDLGEWGFRPYACDRRNGGYVKQVVH